MTTEIDKFPRFRISAELCHLWDGRLENIFSNSEALVLSATFGSMGGCYV